MPTPDSEAIRRKSRPRLYSSRNGRIYRAHELAYRSRYEKQKQEREKKNEYKVRKARDDRGR